MIFKTTALRYVLIYKVSFDHHSIVSFGSVQVNSLYSLFSTASVIKYLPSLSDCSLPFQYLQVMIENWGIGSRHYSPSFQAFSLSDERFSLAFLYYPERILHSNEHISYTELRDPCAVFQLMTLGSAEN